MYPLKENGCDHNIVCYMMNEYLSSTSCLVFTTKILALQKKTNTIYLPSTCETRLPKVLMGYGSCNNDVTITGREVHFLEKQYIRARWNDLYSQCEIMHGASITDTEDLGSNQWPLKCT